MKRRRIRVGLRTVKTAVAIIIAMVLVEPYGATSSRLILAMLGAMAAVQPTFKESLEACDPDGGGPLRCGGRRFAGGAAHGAADLGSAGHHFCHHCL